MDMMVISLFTIGLLAGISLGVSLAIPAKMNKWLRVLSASGWITVILIVAYDLFGK